MTATIPPKNEAELFVEILELTDQIASSATAAGEKGALMERLGQEMERLDEERRVCYELLLDNTEQRVLYTLRWLLSTWSTKGLGRGLVDRLERDA